MFFLFFLNVFCQRIDLTILYENSASNILNSQYLDILNNKISVLNTKLSTPFKFHIETLNSFEQFSNNPNYEELSFLAGSDAIEDRFHNLNPSKNTLLLITSNLNETIFQKKDTSCFKHILMNRNSQLLESKEVIFQLEMGIVALLLKILGIDLKDVNGFLMDSVMEIIRDRKGFDQMNRKCLNGKESQSSDSDSSENKKEYSKLVLDIPNGFGKPYIPKVHTKVKQDGEVPVTLSKRRNLAYPESNIKQVEDTLLRSRKYMPPKFSTDSNFSVGDGNFRSLGLAPRRLKALPMI